jgi:hypothetical protein
MADITTASQAWQQLQDLVRAEAESSTVPSQQPHLLWIQSGRLALIGTWQVEASFAERAGAYQIHFDRFGAQLGVANFEPSPSSTAVSSETWEVQFVEGITQAFWRLNGQDLPSERLARKVMEHLNRYYEKLKPLLSG